MGGTDAASICRICRYWGFGQCCHTGAKAEPGSTEVTLCAYFRDAAFSSVAGRSAR